MANITIIHKESPRKRLSATKAHDCECFECSRKKGITPPRENPRSKRYRSHDGRYYYVFKDGAYMMIHARDMAAHLKAMAEQEVYMETHGEDLVDLTKAAAELGINL